MDRRIEAPRQPLGNLARPQHIDRHAARFPFG